jgi:hypothetical protein
MSIPTAARRNISVFIAVACRKHAGGLLGAPPLGRTSSRKGRRADACREFVGYGYDVVSSEAC